MTITKHEQLRLINKVKFSKLQKAKMISNKSKRKFNRTTHTRHDLERRRSTSGIIPTPIKWTRRSPNTSEVSRRMNSSGSLSEHYLNGSAAGVANGSGAADRINLWPQTVPAEYSFLELVQVSYYRFSFKFIFKCLKIQKGNFNWRWKIREFRMIEKSLWPKRVGTWPNENNGYVLFVLKTTLYRLYLVT